MSFLCVSKIRRRDLLRSDASNMPLEWTGRHKPSVAPPKSLPATQGQRSQVALRVLKTGYSSRQGTCLKSLGEASDLNHHDNLGSSRTPHYV